MIRWVRVTDYSIRSEDARFHIAKSFVDGCSLYCLWDGDKAHMWSDDASECKALAERLNAQSQAVV